MSGVSKEFTSRPNGSIQRLQNLFGQLEQESTGTERFHRLRGQIFQEIGKTYERINHQTVKFFENDKCFKHAESISRGKTFSNHPKSLARLQSPSQKYLESFQSLQNILQQDESEFLNQSFEQSLTTLISTHQVFASIYLAESKIAHTSKVFSIYRSDVNDFVSSFQSFLKTLDQETKFNFHSKICKNSPELLSLLPKIALYDTFDSEKLPKIFQKNKEKYEQVKIEFLKLSRIEKEQIENALKYEKISPLSNLVYHVMGQIEEIAEDSFTGDQIKLGSMLLKETVKQIKNSLDTENMAFNNTIFSSKEIELRSFV